jgi:hypothetical protein
MDESVETRLEAIRRNREAELARTRSERPGVSRRDHLQAAIPKFIADLNHVVAELNDELGESDLYLRLGEISETPVALASFRVKVFDGEGERGGLDVGVDPSGDLHIVQDGRRGRRLVFEGGLASTSRQTLLELLLGLLEAELGSEARPR